MQPRDPSHARTLRVRARAATRPAALSPFWLAAIGAALALLLSLAARAETAVVDGQVTVVPSDVSRPSRGMTMRTVEARFGAPHDRHAAVGNPPITRWDYPHFTVYFEHQYVIDSVVTAG